MTAVITGHASWMDEGACRDHDPELFFPNGASDAETTRYATAICHHCDVEAECLRYALVNHVKHGIWGGHTEEERSVMIRTRGRTQGHRRTRRHQRP